MGKILVVLIVQVKEKKYLSQHEKAPGLEDTGVKHLPVWAAGANEEAH